MPTTDTISLFDLNLVNATAGAALDAALAGPRKTAAFINAHCVNVAAGDVSYRWALGRADFLLPDGSGMQLAAKLKGARFVENLNGTDLFVPLCREAALRDLSIYFLGSEEGVAARAAERARSLAPGLRVAGARNGFFGADEDGAVIDAINAAGADIVLVALGVPKQDVWIARNRHRLNARLVMGVGAQFDFWSGRVRRAPAWMRRLGLEWMMRFAVEPRRMWRRYLLGNFSFVARALAAQSVAEYRSGAEVSGKRALDVALSLGGLVALAPLLLLATAAIRLESKGPALFKQTRIGRDGRPFTLFKFRSMYVDAEARRSALLAKSDRAGVCFKAKNDPRVTRVGRILRRLSIDELPQILNVLRGEMAIVGPRPALPQEVAAYPNRALERLSVKPGLTGLWQVGGRAEIGFDKMIDMDTGYARSRSLALDLAIVALTFRALVSGRGAY